MSLNPEHTHAAFALRSLWQFLVWHYPDRFQDKALKDTVREELKRSHSALDRPGQFLRANPKPETLGAYYEPVRRYVLATIAKHEDAIELPDHIRPYLQTVDGSADEVDRPFNVSSWSVKRQLKLTQGNIEDIIRDIGGFWYVLRGDTQSKHSEVMEQLSSISDKKAAEACPIRFNCGVLRISDMEHSKSALPKFRYETVGRGSQNLKLNGFVFRTHDEIMFQGSYGVQSTGQITWVYTPQRAAKDRSSVHEGILVARNSHAHTIAGIALFLRVPAAHLPDTATPDEAHPDFASLHATHFSELVAQTRQHIGIKTLGDLMKSGVIALEDITYLKRLCRDEIVYSI